MRRQRRTKIVATLGPASSDRSVIANLFAAGADVFRINMSHTSHARMRELVASIRAVESAHARPIGILIDLQGPKLRVGSFGDAAAMLTKGETFALDTDSSPGNTHRVQLPHPEIFAAVEPGNTLLLDDGKIRLEATEVDPNRILTRVEVGGKLSDRKGVSLPDTTIPFSALAEKDRSDLEAALDAAIDWVALSFIQRPEDIAEAKKITRGRAAVMAKIEKPQAVYRLDEIMDLADSLMVARGDLGVEMPLEKVPGVQKHMTRMGRRTGKPVVVATQMLESMIASPVPTRAEVSDVATAIFEGADAIMLSAESAAGQYPVEAVATMDRIAREVEKDALYRGILDAQHTAPEATGSDAIAAADRRDPRSLRRDLLDELRLDRVACCPRAAEIAHRCDLAEAGDVSAPGFDLGRAPHSRGGRARPRRYGRPRLPARLQGRICQNGAARHHRGRRAARHSGGHQHAADRLRRRPDVRCQRSDVRDQSGF
jgi:pyruvate kinase